MGAGGVTGFGLLIVSVYESEAEISKPLLVNPYTNVLKVYVLPGTSPVTASVPEKAGE
jgi:hypothetical protein